MKGSRAETRRSRDAEEQRRGELLVCEWGRDVPALFSGEPDIGEESPGLRKGIGSGTDHEGL